jgi:hypothetical protein
MVRLRTQDLFENYVEVSVRTGVPEMQMHDRDSMVKYLTSEAERTRVDVHDLGDLARYFGPTVDGAALIEDLFGKSARRVESSQLAMKNWSQRKKRPACDDAAKPASSGASGSGTTGGHGAKQPKRALVEKYRGVKWFWGGIFSDY